ncbi:hypothetical protein CTA1_2670 [Colletotrichum tanaceti]|uniref:Uncharacterized protein n=1 Tax=Colletotrichum tanaceti TaxID=1306861 RepID=A0A4U6X4K4_9PEZI|nr:hypothetical protein CTA1_2670 [Colletotrichum tanaceti]
MHYVASYACAEAKGVGIRAATNKLPRSRWLPSVPARDQIDPLPVANTPAPPRGSGQPPMALVHHLAKKLGHGFPSEGVGAPPQGSACGILFNWENPPQEHLGPARAEARRERGRKRPT